MDERRNILIIRLGAIGDVVRTLPALHLLRKRFPEARIAWVIEEKASEILERHPELDEVIILPRRKWGALLKNPLTFVHGISEIRRSLHEIRERKFSTVLDFHSSIKSGIISYASDAFERIGYTALYSREMNFLFNNIRIPLRQRRISRMERNLALLKHFDIATDEIKAEIGISEDDRRYIGDYMKREEIEGMRKVIIFPGASKRQEYKKWGADNYAALISLLMKNADLVPILAWGPGELEECLEIAAKTARQEGNVSPSAPLRRRPAMQGTTCVYISPKTTLKQLAELIRRCDLFIGGDTGAMHISCAIGTPCVVIYGPTDPVINAPWGEKYKIIYDEAECSPCRKRRCRQRTCFENLTPEVVYREIEGFMRELP